ncbi:Thioredoxin F [Picochlorum sp. SENEW3]|nr:Thioredoxin F [Picochlorum sp. SENEW3]
MQASYLTISRIEFSRCIVRCQSQNRVRQSGIQSDVTRRQGRARALVTRAVQGSNDKEAELKKMEDFRKGLGDKLGQVSSSPVSAEAQPSSSAEAEAEADLIEVELDEYWPAVKELSMDGSLLVMDFHTQWCGPCKLMKPTLCEWAEELKDKKVSFRKFEASKKNAPVGKELAIKSVPTLIVYKDGDEVGRVVGNKLAALRELIDAHC